MAQLSQRITAIEAVGIQATFSQTAMAITDLQNRTAQLESNTQQASSTDPMNKKKEILESRAIQNLGSLKDAKD